MPTEILLSALTHHFADVRTYAFITNALYLLGSWAISLVPDVDRLAIDDAELQVP